MAPDINADALQLRKWKRKIQQEFATGGLCGKWRRSSVTSSNRTKARKPTDGLSFDRANWWGVVVDWRD